MHFALYILFVLFQLSIVFGNQTKSRSTHEIIQSCLTEATYQYVKGKVQEAIVEEYPFPHIVIENIFPEDFYKKARSLWPKSSEFAGRNRSILPVTYGTIEQTKLTKEEKVFWRTFGEIIVNRYIKPKIAEKFKPYLHLKTGLENYDITSFDPTQDLISLRQDCLINDSSDYSIRPHIDQPNILSAMLIYFPENDQNEDFGTILLSGPSFPGVTGFSDIESSPLTIAKRIAYKPNTLIAFLQTDFSWHACYSSKPKSHQFKRQLYVAPIFFSPEFMREQITIYPRTYADDYFFDARFLNKNNWIDIWGKTE